MTHPDDTTYFSDGVFFPSVICRSPEEWKELFAVEHIKTMALPRQSKPRRPTLASLSKGIAVARYEIRPDGTIVVVTGTPEPSTESNPWLADLRREEKQ
jgi:hypothetical protein